MSKITLAKEAGFCFGVKRAVDVVLKVQKEYNKKIYTLGPLIHNNDVVKYLENHNIFAVELEDINKLNKNDVIVIRSHGISKKIFELLESKGLIVKNATCPYVTNIQKKVEKYENAGFQIINLGDKNHPEVKGINGWCNDNAIISKDGTLPKDLPKKVCVVSQTTEKKENFNKIVDNLSHYDVYSEVFNTICLATDVRQNSAIELSKKVDAMIVIGGKNSSNTTKLFELSKMNCENTIHIENASEISKDFIDKNKNNKIGITAGASTPDWIIREVINIMEQNSSNTEQQELMNEYDKSYRVGSEVEGEILQIENDEIIISIPGYGIEGTIPFKELSILSDPAEVAKNLNKGDKIKAKIIKLQNSDNFVVLSRTEYERELVYTELEEMYNNKTTFEVKISSAKEKGLVAYYKGVRIFIPASQIDIRFVNNKEEFVNKTIGIRLIEFSKENPNKIIASRRVILEEEKNEKEAKAWDSFNVGDVVKGEIKRFTSFGAFAEVNGVDGLIHLSQISWKHVNKPEDVLKKGEVVDVKIIDLDKENKKLSLSIKQLTPEPWSNAKEKYPEGSVVLGKVVRINDFGAFVELEPGLDALVHISKISHDRIEHPSQVLTIGEEIKAKILSVDEEKKRISLSMKDV